MLVVAIKNRLQEWIDEAGLNYSTMAAAAGVHVQTVRRIAKNQSDRVDVATMGALCKALGKDVGDFFYEE